MNKSRRNGLWKHRVVVKQSLAFLLGFLAFLSGLSGFLGLISVAAGQGEGAIIVEVVPLLDKYGHFAVNDDGSFYPCDRFEVSYWVDLSDEFVFENVDISYNSAVFSMFSSSGLGSMVGVGLFEVLSSAPAGTYQFYLEVWGHISEPELDPELEFDVEREIESFVLATARVSVQVVMYESHFTVALTYVIPTGSGSSFEKPFALIVRYDGNGPDYNLNQRAIIDNYAYTGYAQKLSEMDTMQQQNLTPNLTIKNFINQTSNNMFQTQGLTTKTSQQTLTVDQTNYKTTDLPIEFIWETNTNHTYQWIQTLPVTTTSDGYMLEWFEWQTTLPFPPQINPNLQQNSQTPSQQDLQNQLIEQFNTPNGTLTATPFGNTITAIYAHNKHLDIFAKDAGVGKEAILNCLTEEPMYFTAQNRYAKIQYQLNPAVVKEIIAQNFTNNLYYNLTIGCDLFGTPRFFEANFTCEYEFLDKPFNATAYKWNPTQQTWNIDNTINIQATFESALNITTTDILQTNLEEQTTDQTALKMAMEDLYDSGSQTFTGTGSIEANLRHTSPLYYNLKITAGQQQKTTLQKTVQINFQNNNTYHLPLNFDPNSPLQVTTLADSSQNTILNIDAPTELGGLTNITVYQITNIPNKNWNNLQKNQLNLKLLKTVELTLPQEQVQMPLEHEQFYQYYSGYSAVLEDILGFHGQTQIPIQKDKTTITLTNSGEALLYIEATNVWGTTFHQITTIQPYSTPQWHIPLAQATTYLILIVIIAIIVSFVTYLIKAKQ